MDGDADTVDDPAGAAIGSLLTSVGYQQTLRGSVELDVGCFRAYPAQSISRPRLRPRSVCAGVPSEAGVELISVDFQGDTVVSTAFEKAVDLALGEFVQAELLVLDGVDQLMK